MPPLPPPPPHCLSLKGDKLVVWNFMQDGTSDFPTRLFSFFYFDRQTSYFLVPVTVVINRFTLGLSQIRLMFQSFSCSVMTSQPDLSSSSFGFLTDPSAPTF